MNRRGFLKFFSVATVAAVVRPVMPFVASLIDKSDPWEEFNKITLKMSQGWADIFFAPNPLFEHLQRRAASMNVDGGRKLQEPFSYSVSEAKEWKAGWSLDFPEYPLKNINVLPHFPPEGSSEDSTVGWDGNVFQTYGTISRKPHA